MNETRDMSGMLTKLTRNGVLVPGIDETIEPAARATVVPDTRLIKAGSAKDTFLWMTLKKKEVRVVPPFVYTTRKYLALVAVVTEKALEVRTL